MDGSRYNALVRRIIRSVLTLFSGLSLLLCIGVCGLWVRSFFVADIWSRTSDLRRGGVDTYDVARIHSARGVFAFNFSRQVSRPMSDHAVYVDRRGRRISVAAPGDLTTVTTSWNKLAASDVDVSARTWLQWLGFDSFGQTRTTPTGTDAYSGFWLPHWLVALLLASFAGMTGRFAKRARRRLRAARGLCLACGYDLRASPGRCPECGYDATMPVGSLE